MPRPVPNKGLAFRLDPTLRARAYRVHIRVDPTRSAQYDGRVEIECDSDVQRSFVELHAAELTLHRASLADEAGAQTAEIEPHPERETFALRVARRLRRGALRVVIEFASSLRSDLRGFYAAKAGERSYAFTQLEAADARRFFPCFDEPAQKARWQLSVTIPCELTAVSNSPVERVEPSEHGQRTLHFRQTPLLSSYLVALAVGELAVSEAAYAGRVPIRIVHVPGAEHMTRFALQTACECLTRLAEYFAVPYPYEKLDLVAVPDFEIGAMENAGAVFFRETLLLVDENSVSVAEKKRAAEVICHELAHMWYGNLVTMQFWDDLWLNEAFATWMAFDIVAKWRPQWKMWNDFGHARDSALQLDALTNTHAIYSPVYTPAQASENFDLITYEKGAAVVRMIERYLGAGVFRRGVRRYIKRHREGNTVAKDLWRALSEAAGHDVEAVVRPFIERPGFPLLRIERTTKANKPALRLSQERFDAAGPAARARKPPTASRSAARDQPASLPWPIPWVGRVGQGTKVATVRSLLRRRSQLLELGGRAPQFVYGNADEGGFFRPLHHPRDLPDLLRALPLLLASERLGLAQHQWAALRAGYAQLPDFMALVGALATEREPDVLRALVGPCDHLIEDIARAVGNDAHAQLRTRLSAWFEPELTTLGMQPAPDEPSDTRLRRCELLTLVAVVAEAPAAVELAQACCEAYLRDRSSLDANLIAPVLTIGARCADAARLTQFLAASESDPTPQGRRRFRIALSDVRDPALIEQVLGLCLTSRIPTQDVAFVLARLLRNPRAGALAFDFIREQWPRLRERVPTMLMSRLIDALPALGGEANRRAVMAFFAAHPLPTAGRALRQANERFRLDTAFRKRTAPALRRWLRERPARL